MVALPEGVDSTCDAAADGAMYDYVVHSLSFKPFLVAVRAVVKVPWETHCAVVVEMTSTPCEVVVAGLFLS